MIDFTQIKDLSRNPILKAQLTRYCLFEYEEDAIIDDEHLMMEYNKLKSDNELEKLYLLEQMENYYRELEEADEVSVYDKELQVDSERVKLILSKQLENKNNKEDEGRIISDHSETDDENLPF